MRSLLAAVLLVSLSACALPQQRSRTFTPYAPLEAYITSTAMGGPLFHVNRPAYVAMFYIAPGQGVSMLYPGFGSGSLTGRVFAGSHFANNRVNNAWQYVPTRASMNGPRYYFLIASDRPLNVQQFGSFGDGLSSRLGTSFASFSAYSAMERIAELTLPVLADDGTWTTDMYVEWPNVLFSEPAARRVLVSCNGYAMYVAAGYVNVVRSMLCDPARDRRQLDEDDQSENDGEDRPVVRPRGRTPIAPQPEADQVDETGKLTQAERRAVRDRLGYSSQLAGPAAREVIEAPRDEFGYIRQRERPGYSTGAGAAAASPSTGSQAGRAASSGSRPASRGSAAPVGGARGSAGAAPAPDPSRGGGSVSAPAPRPSSSSGGSTAAPSGGSRGGSRATVD